MPSSQFPIEDVLTILHGRQFTVGLEGPIRVIEYLNGNKLPRSVKVILHQGLQVRSLLRRQLPQLAAQATPPSEASERDVLAWVEKMRQKYGNTVSISPL